MKYDVNLPEQKMLEPGIYQAIITKCEDGISKKGNEMFIIYLQIFSENSTSRNEIKDWITESSVYKLKKLFQSANKPELFNGETNASDLEGLLVTIQTKNTEKEYIDQMGNNKIFKQIQVEDYVCKELNQDDEIPF